MPAINRETSILLIIDFQSRLMPAIEDGVLVTGNARRLIDAAEMLDVPIVFTEQNASGLGSTVPELRSDTAHLVHKMTFDACRMPGFLNAPPDRPNLIVSGCETHVCVLQTVLGLLNAGRRVYAVRDAMGSRRAESKETAIQRMERNGAEIVTTEMVFVRMARDRRRPPSSQSNRSHQVIERAVIAAGCVEGVHFSIPPEDHRGSDPAVRVAVV